MFNTMEVAEKILAEVKEIAQDMDGWILWPYLNGRESGLSITNRDKQVAFSENRNSDDIVVYYGTWQDFKMAGHVPEENAEWHFFDSDDPEKAAKFIVEFLSSASGK